MTATKKEDPKAEELVPYQCYACLLWDGTIGPPDLAFEHLCTRCKDIDPSTDPIARHVDEYIEKEAVFEEAALEGLMCPHCRMERDECACVARIPFGEDDVDEGYEETETEEGTEENHPFE